MVRICKWTFWTVDPDEYEDLIDEWLEDTKLEQLDAFHVIARSAFGDLYACGKKTGRSVTIACPLNKISALPKGLKPKSKEDLDLSIYSFFGSSDKSRFNLKDESGKLLFDRAVERLGKLASDEMYGFEPALVLGGRMRRENLVKVKTDAHLTILRQLATPILPLTDLDIDKLLGL